MTEQSANKPAISKRVLIDELQALAAALGRTPIWDDIVAASQRGDCHNVEVYQKEFGTLTSALRRARLPLDPKRDLPREQLLDQLNDLAFNLGRKLCDEDIALYGRTGACARRAKFQKVFGSLRTAFREAGVSAYQRVEYTRDELLAQLVALCKEIKKLPGATDLDKASKQGKCASSSIFKSRFGGVWRAREEAGLSKGKVIGKPKKFTAEMLIKELKGLAKKLGRTPTSDDVRDASLKDEGAALKTYYRIFGGHNQALAAAGLAPNKASTYSKGQLILLLRDLAKKLGRRPSQGDINRASQKGECAAAKTYINYFGSLKAAVRAAQIELPGYESLPRSAYVLKLREKLPEKIYTDAQMIELLQALAQKLGKQPTQEDVYAASQRRECPSVTTFRDRFGSFGKALSTAGFQPLAKIRYSRDEMIGLLREMTVELGRLPTSRDIAEWCKRGRGPDVRQYQHEFGSVQGARAGAGLEQVLRETGERQRAKRVAERYHREALIEQLVELTQRLGRIPTTQDVIQGGREGLSAGIKPFLREFGSIPNAREAAKLSEVLAAVEEAGVETVS